MNQDPKERIRPFFWEFTISKQPSRRVGAFGTYSLHPPPLHVENQKVIPSHHLQRKYVLRNLKIRYFLITPKGLLPISTVGGSLKRKKKKKKGSKAALQNARVSAQR